MAAINLAVVSIMDIWRSTWKRFQNRAPWLAYSVRRGAALGMGYLFADTWLGYSSAVVLPIWVGGCVESLIWESAVPRWTGMVVPPLPHGWRGTLTAIIRALPGVCAALTCALLIHRAPGTLGTIAGLALLSGSLGWMTRDQVQAEIFGEREIRPWVAKVLRRVNIGSISPIEDMRIP